MDTHVGRYPTMNLLRGLTILAFGLVVYGDEFHTCVQKDPKCDSDLSECSRSIRCNHGACDKLGNCICDFCWHGQKCDQYADDHPPVFQVKSTYVSVYPSDTGILFTTDAFDADLSLTCQYDTSRCPCADIEYSFDTSSKHKETFEIERSTGVVSLRTGSSLTPGSDYHLVIKASSADHNTSTYHQVSDYFEVTVHVLNESFSNEVDDFMNGLEHDAKAVDSSRRLQKRSAQASNTPNTVLTSLKQLSPADNKLGLGLSAKFKLEILLANITSTNMLVQIFTNDSNTGESTMSLCSLEVVKVGSSLTSDKGDIKEIKAVTSKNSKGTWDDGAEFDFGTITNDDTSGNNETSIITITFLVIMVDTPAFKAGNKYVVTAGAQYDNEGFVWIGQSEIVGTTPDGYVKDKEYESDFDITGDEEVHEEETGLYTISAYVSKPAAYVTLEVYEAAENMIDKYSVGSTVVKAVGKNYPCMADDKNGFPDYMNKSTSGETVQTRYFDIGTVFNCDDSKDRKAVGNADSLIDLQVAIFPRRGSLELPDSELAFSVGMQIDDETLWTGVATITILPYREQSGTPPKLSLVSPTDDETIPEKGVVLIQFQLEYGNDTFYDTKLEISVSDPESLSICQASLLRLGDNIPFVPKFNHEFTPGPQPNTSKEAVVELGRIQTITRLANNNSANTMVFEVGVRNLKKVSGASITVKVGDSTEKSALITTAVVNASSDVTVNFENVLESTVLFPSGETAINMDVDLPERGHYEPFEIEVMGQFGNNTVEAKICRLEIFYSGRLLPCLNETVINQFAVYNKTSESREVNDRGILAMDQACRAYDWSKQRDPRDNRMRIQFVAEIPPQAALTDESTYWLNAGVRMGSTGIAVGSFKYDLKAADDLVMDEYCGPDFQLISDKLGSVAVASAAYSFARIKFPMRSRATYKLTVSVDSDVLGICRLVFAYVGHNMPCIDSTTYPGKVEMASTTWVNYIPQDDATLGDKQAIMDFGSLANVGNVPMTDDAINDVNTLYIGIPIHANKAESGKTVKYVWEVNGKAQEPVTAIVNVTDKSEAIEQITLNFTTFDGDDKIYKHATKVLVLDLIIPSAFSDSITITFDDADKTDKISFCSASVTTLGWNVPCVNASKISANVSDEFQGPNECSPSILINLPHVCHANEFNETETSLLRVEVGLNAIDELKDPVKVTAKVETTNAPSDATLTLTPTQDELLNITQLPNNSAILLPDEIAINVSQKAWIPINITVPVYETVPLIVVVTTPVEDKRAILTVYDARFKSGGVNLGCVRNRTLVKTTLNKTADIKFVSQKNRITADFGLVTNLAFTKRRFDYKRADDVMTIEVEVRMTDHPAVDDGKNFTVEIVVQSKTTEITLTQNVTARRPCTEQVQLDAEIISDKSTFYKQGGLLIVQTILKHSNTSTLEPMVVYLRYLNPAFVEYQDSKSNSSRVIKSETSYIQLELDNFLFDSIIEVNLTMTIDPNGVLPAGSPIQMISVIFTAVCDVHDNKCTEYPTGFHFCSEKLIPSYLLDALSCDVPLGLKDQKLNPCQFAASSAMNVDTVPSNGLVGGTKWWSPAFRHGLKNHYFQVDFGNMTDVREILIEQAGDDTEPIASYQVQISTNGRVWNDHGKKIDTKYVKNVHQAPINIKTRYVRINIVQTSEPTKPLGAKFEFLGCVVGKNVPEKDVCKVSTPVIVSDNASVYRHFIAAGGDSVYVCDYVHPKQKLSCFCTADGKSWKALPANVGYLLGYNEKEQVIVASDKKGKTKLMTKDCKKWQVAPATHTTGLTESVVVPGYTEDKLKGLKSGKWTGDFEGLKLDGTLKLSWKDCCKS